MYLNHDPFPVIFGRGDEVIKLACLDFFGLGDSPPAMACLIDLIKQQRSDGAFPSRLNPEMWGMRETVRNALLLARIGLPVRGVNREGALRFILRHQWSDGGWYENPAQDLPPEQTWLSSERSMTWLTADVIALLRQSAMGEGQECRTAIALLRETQNRHGGWPSLAGGLEEHQVDTGDPDATAQITFLMAELFGEEDPVYLRGKELFERSLDGCAAEVERGYWIRRRDGRRQELDVYTLTHLLISWWLDPHCRFQAGYDVGDARVRAMMEALVGIQRTDGGWRPFFAQDSSPVYTLLAVKALVLSGMLAQEDLQSGVERYAA
ncbi:MAG TPA: prenyltransferase/squalene oxidase repeat-containing protein [Anaerolineae bacterium]|nr:prenyltransferase/squalene oxidase repeat-containing protein [Anaerolineae bacterium]